VILLCDSYCDCRLRIWNWPLWQWAQEWAGEWVGFYKKSELARKDWP